jgi:hypothetical protein
MIISCPECGKKLRMSPAAGSGKRIRCPGCSAVFSAAPEDADKEPPRRVARATTKRAPELDEDDEEHDRVRSKSRRDDKPDEEDEEDDRPARRTRESRGRVSDDDDRPRSRRKKKRKKQGSSAMVWVALGGGAAVLIGVAVVVILLARGGSSGAYAQHEAAEREAIGLVKELITVLESVQDANTARLAATKINNICERVEALHKRTRSLGKITAEENRRLKEKIESELAPMKTRMSQAGFQAGARCQGEPTFIAALKRMDSLRNLGG